MTAELQARKWGFETISGRFTIRFAKQQRRLEK